jgi:hypothetical protein
MPSGLILQYPNMHAVHVRNVQSTIDTPLLQQKTRTPKPANVLRNPYLSPFFKKIKSLQAAQGAGCGAPLLN